MKALFHKITVAVKMVAVYKNWLRLIAYRVDLLPAAMIVRLRDGSKIKVRDRHREPADAYVINESWLYGIHDKILPYLKNAKVGVDIGAHIGAFSVFAARSSPAAIVAVEPAPNNRRILKENIQLNNLRGRVVVLPAVVSSRRGQARLYMPENSGLAATSRKHLELYRADVGTRSIKVPAITLPDIFKKERIKFCDFIKMDCEGCEYDILYNLPEQIFGRIGIMTVECHADGNINKLMEFLRSKNFEVERPSLEFGEIFCRNRHYNVT